MIVNFCSSNSKGVYELDHVLFDENLRWEFSLLNFVGVFKGRIKHEGIYELSTNMIERDDGNLPRAIAYLFISTDSSHVTLSPTQKLSYKLRFHDLSSTVFNLRAIATNDIVSFSEVAFQIEIRETYGRF